MTILQVAAMLTLWRSGKFDTQDIATVLGFSEADVCRALDVVKDHERGERFTVIEGGRA